MSCQTSVLLLHALQQHVLHSQKGVASGTYMSGSGTMAFYTRNAHITAFDVTTWSWVSLVNPRSIHPVGYRI